MVKSVWQIGLKIAKDYSLFDATTDSGTGILSKVLRVRIPPAPPVLSTKWPPNVIFEGLSFGDLEGILEKAQYFVNNAN